MMRIIFALVLSILFISTTCQLIGGGDHDYQPHGVEKKTETSIIGGGDHDYVPHGVEKKTEKSIIGGGDHDYVPHGLKFLESIIDTIVAKFGGLAGGDGGFHDYLFRATREELTGWALGLEGYHRDGKMILGGLHDRINSMTKEDILAYVQKELAEHKEINNFEKLNELIAKKPVLKLGGGIHDIIRALPREELNQWAIAAETYHRMITNKTNMRGGIHDYVARMETEAVIAYIMNQVEDHPELNSRSKFDELCKK